MSEIVIPSNPVDQEQIKKAIVEADESMIRISAEMEHIKSIIDDVSEKFELDAKYVRKMIKVYHKQNFDSVEGEAEDFSALYSTIIK